MPTYDFICPECNYKFEDIVPYEKRNEQICPKCGSVVKIDVTSLTPNLHNVG